MHDTVEPPSPKQYAVLSLINIPNTRLNTRDGVPALTHHWVNVPRDLIHSGDHPIPYLPRVIKHK